MDAELNETKRSAWNWIWWAMVLPLVITIFGGLAVEYLKPDKSSSHGGLEEPAASKADGNRTYEYWCAIDQIQQRAMLRYAVDGKSSRENVVGLLKTMAESLEKLPARGVNADAIEVSHGLAESMRRLAGFLERNLSAASTVQAPMQALLFGDPSDSKDQAAGGRDLQTFLEEAATKARKTRALLSSRYDREFPALDATPSVSPRHTEGPNLASIFRMSRELAKAPMVAELSRLRNEVDELDRQIKTHFEKLARSEVEKAHLENDVSALSAKAEDAKRTADTLRAKAEQEANSARNGKEIALRAKASAERAKATADALNERRKLLESRNAQVQILREQLEALRKERDRMRQLLEGSEASVEQLRLANDDLSKGKMDNTSIEKSRQLLDEIKQKLNKAEREAERRNVSGGLP